MGFFYYLRRFFCGYGVRFFRRRSRVGFEDVRKLACKYLNLYVRGRNGWFGGGFRFF